MRYLNHAILLAASLLGAGSLLLPFFAPPAGADQAGPMAHAGDAPVIFVALVVLCLGAVAANLAGRQMNSKVMAVLGVLTAMNAVLRAIPGPGGFSAIFVLPILTGYVYGSTFGFLLGSLSLLISALIGAGIGPWLPYQMLCAGWVGMISGWLPHLRRPQAEMAVLIGWGVLSGLIFGAVMNLWFWPFINVPGEADLYWSPGATLAEGLRRYLAFYLLTSAWWDAMRAAGNAVLLALFGRALVTTLRRYQRRFQFSLG
ncbi:MAG: ECF transporter S component [Anaerolineae bacterium]|nr:ECF transporter S component [Anaerolineae bacterium]